MTPSTRPSSNDDPERRAGAGTLLDQPLDRVVRRQQDGGSGEVLGAAQIAVVRWDSVASQPARRPAALPSKRRSGSTGNGVFPELGEGRLDGVPAGDLRNSGRHRGTRRKPARWPREDPRALRSRRLCSRVSQPTSAIQSPARPRKATTTRPVADQYPTGDDPGPGDGQLAGGTVSPSPDAGLDEQAAGTGRSGQEVQQGQRSGEGRRTGQGGGQRGPAGADGGGREQQQDQRRANGREGLEPPEGAGLLPGVRGFGDPGSIGPHAPTTTVPARSPRRRARHAEGDLREGQRRVGRRPRRAVPRRRRCRRRGLRPSGSPGRDPTASPGGAVRAERRRRWSPRRGPRRSAPAGPDRPAPPGRGTEMASRSPLSFDAAARRPLHGDIPMMDAEPVNIQGVAQLSELWFAAEPRQEVPPVVAALCVRASGVRISRVVPGADGRKER